MKYFILIFYLLLVLKQGTASDTSEIRKNGIPVEIDGRCYFFARFEALNYGNAKTQCNSTLGGMVLASFETEEEYNAVMKVISQRPELDFWMWTSGRRSEGSNVWSWDLEGEMIEIEYNEWINGSPNEAAEEAACLNFSFTAQGWDDDACNIRMSYLCEEESDEPVGCQ